MEDDAIPAVRVREFDGVFGAGQPAGAAFDALFVEDEHGVAGNVVPGEDARWADAQAVFVRAAAAFFLIGYDDMLPAVVGTEFDEGDFGGELAHPLTNLRTCHMSAAILPTGWRLVTLRQMNLRLSLTGMGYSRTIW